MDPVTIILIGVVALALGPKLGTYALYGGTKLFKKIKSNLKKNRQYRRRHNKKIQARNKATIEMQKAIERNRTVEFTNIKTRAKKRVNVQEKNSFDFNQDNILHGRVIVKNPDGTERKSDNIYLFQPRLYGANNVFVGPKIDKKGNICDNNSYLLRLPNEEGIYSGYIPKRDVVSGLPFDLVDDSVNADLGNLATLNYFIKDEKVNLNSLKNFISIELDKDENGNFIPLNKNNRAEMEAFNKYCKDRQSIDQPSYLMGLVQDALESKEQYDYMNRPNYAKPIETPNPREMQRIQKARASKAKRDAQNNRYYGRIADMNMMDSAMHAYNLDEHASHVMGPHVGAPMPPNGSHPQGQPGPGRGRRH